MAVCYFNNDYTNRYNCSYKIDEDVFTVNAIYPIEDEVKCINGVRTFGSYTTFDDRDILVIDSENKINYLLKKAYYSGHTVTYGHPDGDEITCFKARTFLSSSSWSAFMNFGGDIKTKTIRIESSMIIDDIGVSSIKKISYEEEEVIHLSKKITEDNIIINQNNIESISVGDYWRYLYNIKENINIDIIGYIDIKLRRKISYEEVVQYVNELIIFMQLYKPGKFVIDNIKIMIEKEFCKLTTPIFEVKEVNRYIKPSVDCNLISFLKECYAKIPYRKSKSYIRNIPYIIIKNEQGIEDAFLAYYRFIECYYKSSGIKGASNSFIEFGIQKHSSKKFLSDDDQEKWVREVISLRNKYVHSGYYLRNSCLRVNFPMINNRKNPKNYTATDIDGYWIYERAILLKEIAVDIIFKEMLGFENYDFKVY